MNSELTKKLQPIAQAIFHQPVPNGRGEVQAQFNLDSNTEGRRVSMWLYQSLLLCLHENLWFATPLNNCSFLRFAKEVL